MEKLVKQLRRLSIERRPEACLGCGFEYGCSVHGCAVIKRAAATITELLENEDENIRAEFEQLMCAKSCVSGLSMLLKAMDGKMVMDRVRPIAEKRLNQYRERYHSAKVTLNMEG